MFMSYTVPAECNTKSLYQTYFYVDTFLDCDQLLICNIILPSVAPRISAWQNALQTLIKPHDVPPRSAGRCFIMAPVI